MGDNRGKGVGELQEAGGEQEIVVVFFDCQKGSMRWQCKKDTTAPGQKGGFINEIPFPAGRMAGSRRNLRREKNYGG
jgi:hypothetical protein